MKEWMSECEPHLSSQPLGGASRDFKGQPETLLQKNKTRKKHNHLAHQGAKQFEIYHTPAEAAGPHG